VWVLVIVGVILIGLFSSPSGYFKWLSVALAGAVLVTFVVQLALPAKEGLVLRMMASIGGSVVVLAVATAVLGPLSA
jgi:hypothetical protein